MGVSQDRSPSLTSLAARVDVNGFEVEPTGKIVLGVTGRSVTGSARPKQCSRTTLSSWTTTMATPGMPISVHWASILSASVCNPGVGAAWTDRTVSRIIGIRQVTR